MKIYAALRDAWLGWVLLLRKQRLGLEYFRLTWPGLITALVLFYGAIFVAVMLASMQIGVPTAAGFVEIIFIQSLWLVALLLGIWSTRFVVGGPILRLEIIIPAIYGLVFYLLIGTVVTVISTAIMPLLWLGLAFMLYRLGRVGAEFNRGVSAAFAILTVVLLVGLPGTLYMLGSPTFPAA